MNKRNFTLYSLFFTHSRQGREGFTLIEVLVALTAVAVMVIAATSFIFTLFSQRDQAVADSVAADQAAAVFSIIGDAIRSAQTIEVLSGGSRLELANTQECWTFEYNSVEEEIWFARSTGSSCTPPVNATNRLSSQQADIEALNFTIVDPDESSRTVSVTMTVGVYRPMFNTNKTFNQAYVNVIDE